MSKGRWHGSNIRGDMYFGYGGAGASDLHWHQINLVAHRLEELLDMRDGNGRAPVQLVFTRLDHVNPVIAYRWTSEWADQRYDHELVSLGGSLGRGMWTPWEDKFTFDEFVR